MSGDLFHFEDRPEIFHLIHRAVESMEKIEAHLEKLANPMMVVKVPPSTPSPVYLPPPGPVPPGTFEVTS